MTRWNSEHSNWSSAFNTPLECGLRISVILSEAYPKMFDLQRLINYDYLLVHSGDIDGGPESIHPPTPHRSGELHARRPLIEQGISMMLSKSIIECHHSSEGISYSAGEWSIAFLESLESSYTNKLKQRAQWVVNRFAKSTDKELTAFMRKHWNDWGSEFEFESLIRESEE